MDLSEQIKSMILSGIVEEQHRKIGVEIESFYYEKGDLRRLALDNNNKYSWKVMAKAITFANKDKRL